MIDKGSCDKWFIWNPSNCECKCHKSCDIGEYLDYENWKCSKKLVHKLVEECTENVDEKEIFPEKLHSEKTVTPVCSSYTIYITPFSFLFTIKIGIATYFIYYKYINHDKKTVAKEGSILQTTIYWIKFLKHIKTVKNISIKNRNYSFFNYLIALKDFDETNLKVDKNYHKHIDIYYTGYTTIKKLMIMKIFIV